MRVIYSKPELKDLSKGSRIAFIKQFRYMCKCQGQNLKKCQS